MTSRFFFRGKFSVASCVYRKNIVDESETDSESDSEYDEYYPDSQVDALYREADKEQEKLETLTNYCVDNPKVFKNYKGESYSNLYNAAINWKQYMREYDETYTYEVRSNMRIIDEESLDEIFRELYEHPEFPKLDILELLVFKYKVRILVKEFFNDLSLARLDRQKLFLKSLEEMGYYFNLEDFTLKEIRDLVLKMQANEIEGIFDLAYKVFFMQETKRLPIISSEDREFINQMVNRMLGLPINENRGDNEYLTEKIDSLSEEDQEIIKYFIEIAPRSVFW